MIRFNLLQPSIMMAEETSLATQALTLIFLLALAAFIAVFVRKIRLPYTVALVLVGLALSLFANTLDFEINSDVILLLLVPPLVFEAGLHLDWKLLRENLFSILLTAIVGTLLSTTVVAFSVFELLDIPLVAAVAFGALVSATDPVAVIAFFRSLGVNRRLMVLMEGESLFNDAVAIVTFGLAVTMATTIAGGGTVEFSIPDIALEFITVAGGGLLVGSVMGAIVSLAILRYVDDHLIETLVTLTLAYGSYLVAEEFGHLFGHFFANSHIQFSGILAGLAAAMFVGNVGHRNTSPTTKVAIDNFWEFMAYVVNSIVFLGIGLDINVRLFGSHWLPILVAVAAILVARALVIYSLTWLNNRLMPKKRISMKFQHVMFWGGLRGAISLALALTLSPAVFGAETTETLQVMTYGVVLFTLLVQGLSMEPFIKRLGLADNVPQRTEQQRRQARIYAKRAGRQELDKLRDQGILSAEIWRAMSEMYDQDINRATAALHSHLADYSELEQEMVLQARADALRAERVAITDAFRRDLISDEVAEGLTREVDERAAALKIIKRNRGLK